jgi:hypothetical protein
MIEVGIAQLIAANAAVQALIGSPARLYPVLVPEDPTYPCASYQLISEVPRYLIDGSSAMNQIRFQIDTWSGGLQNASYLTAKAVQAAIRAVLEGFTGLLSDGSHVAWIEVVSARDLYEQNARCYRTSTDYMIYFNPA